MIKKPSETSFCRAFHQEANLGLCCLIVNEMNVMPMICATHKVSLICNKNKIKKTFMNIMNQSTNLPWLFCLYHWSIIQRANLYTIYMNVYAFWIFRFVFIQNMIIKVLQDNIPYRWKWLNYHNTPLAYFEY